MHVFQVLDYAICVASNLQTDANASSSMASWVGNMIISIVSYNANTCGDNVNNITLFALGVNTRSTLDEVGLSHPLYKGGLQPSPPFCLC